MCFFDIFSRGYCENWCIQGPFLGFRWSKDDGKTWNEPREVLKGDLVGKMGEAKESRGEGCGGYGVIFG